MSVARIAAGFQAGRSLGAIMWMALACGLALASTRPLEAQSPPIQLEILNLDPSAGSGQEWIRALEPASLKGIRIRSKGDGITPQITRQADGSWRVTGWIDADNQLVLPGGRLTLNGAAAQWKRWLDQSTGSNSPAPNVERRAFGMTDQQLLAIHDRLARPLSQSTHRREVKSIIRDIRRRIGIPIQVDRSAKRGIAQAFEYEDQMQGLSAGTALAAVLRPLGLVMQPSWSASGPSVRIYDSQAVTEFWPIGWPPQEKPESLTPIFFEFLPIEISDVTARETLEALRGRMELPFLLDQNGMAENEIDLDRTRVSLPAGRTFYKRALDRVLYQARMRAETRVDEAGNPFLWLQGFRKMTWRQINVSSSCTNSSK